MIPYAELCVTSNFTFLTGASHPEELVSRAAELGLSAIAITDRNSVAGVVRAFSALKELARLRDKAQTEAAEAGPSHPGQSLGAPCAIALPSQASTGALQKDRAACPSPAGPRKTRLRSARPSSRGATPRNKSARRVESR